MDFKRYLMAGLSAVGLTGVASATWDETLNTTIDTVVGILPKIGDLLTGVGDNLIWPIIQILIILGIGSMILMLFGVVTGVVAAVVVAVHKFANKMGGKGRY